MTDYVTVATVVKSPYNSQKPHCLCHHLSISGTHTGTYNLWSLVCVKEFYASFFIDLNVFGHTFHSFVVFLFCNIFALDLLKLVLQTTCSCDQKS